MEAAGRTKSIFDGFPDFGVLPIFLNLLGREIIQPSLKSAALYGWDFDDRRDWEFDITFLKIEFSLNGFLRWCIRGLRSRL